jgi:7-cyano-7-deazaguanine synthase
MGNDKAILILSGGMDSVTLLYDLVWQGWDVEAITFDYGQRHRREIDSARRICSIKRVKHTVVDLTSVTALLGGSSLTDPAVNTPHGHYAAENMKLTVVPNRNAIMLSIAIGAAVASGALAVATAVHAGDHFIYPDCRPEFVKAMRQVATVGNEGFIDPNFVMLTPYLNLTKTEIALLGDQYSVPYGETWTCYEGGEVHCGLCGACQERKEAFRDAGLPDNTVYEVY